MCGIVGFIGNRTDVGNLLLDSLKKLEYRGYDSAGLSVLDQGRLDTRKKAGRVDALAQLLHEKPVKGTVGISHTRWATHGLPVDINAHPHSDASGKIGVVHNGIVENFQMIRDRLLHEGHTFVSATDTEALAHLIGQFYVDGKHFNEKGFVEAVRAALRQVIGAYGICVLCADCPEMIVGARQGSPLVVGIGKGEHFFSSDVHAMAPHTRDVVYLNDEDIAVIHADYFYVERLDRREAKVQITQVDDEIGAAEKGDFPHYMLKEIFEQPQTMQNTLRGRFNREEASVVFGGLNMTQTELRKVERIIMIGCGTSRHAALLGEYLIEEIAGVPCEVEYASEFRYRNPPLHKNTLFFAIAQSGETIDTLAAMREAQRKGYKTLGICNVVGSTIARESDGGIYLHAGPEIGVCATKTFTSQMTVMALVALHLGRLRHLSSAEGARLIRELEMIPEKISQILKQTDSIRRIADQYKNAKNFLYLGRRYHYPIALEGALKLKEISYIHAEGYPAAEMKHGPIALIDEKMPSVIICPQDAIYEKTMNNIEQVKARRGPVIAVATEGDEQIVKKADDVIFIPSTIDPFYPLLTNISLQLLAYHIAVFLGRDVDKPRNLAKSVTVE